MVQSPEPLNFEDKYLLYSMKNLSKTFNTCLSRKFILGSLPFLSFSVSSFILSNYLLGTLSLIPSIYVLWCGITNLWNEKSRVESLHLHENGRRLIITVLNGGQHIIHILDLEETQLLTHK